MQTPDLYCDKCGAANSREAVICFACQCPLRRSPANYEPDEPGPEAEQEPDVYIQFTLTEHSITTTRLAQRHSQPEVDLLHGRYEVLEKVGTGGFGAVYKARDRQRKNRMVAIKAIELNALSAAQTIEATDTFNRELSLLSNLDHSHLPGLYEHFIDATHWYLVMDFIDGEPLDDYLQQLQEPCLPLEEVIDIGLQLCDVLHYLHQLEPPIIFRDVKPANIMRTPGGRLYLIDFGIARRFKPGQARDTTPLGSPGFAAPEQYGGAQSTIRTDIYGLGATLYFLLTGHDPATTPFNLPPILSLCSSLPEPLAGLITSMLAYDLAERPANIQDVKELLMQYDPVALRAAGRALQLHSARFRTPTPTASHAPKTLSSVPQSIRMPAGLRRLSGFLKGLFSLLVIYLVARPYIIQVNLLEKNQAWQISPLFSRSTLAPLQCALYSMTPAAFTCRVFARN